MSDLPNYGVNFCLGSYTIELIAISGYGQTRRFVVSNDNGAPTGLNPEYLIDLMEIDIARLRDTVRKFVKDSKKLEESENNASKKRKNKDGI